MFNFMKASSIERSNKWIFGTMLAFGIIGLFASFVLAVEEFHLLKNPEAILSCSINIVLNCSTVMKTWQASVFGFPNMFIGLMGYAVVVTVAVVALAGAKLPKWFWVTANIGYGLGAIFSYWLFFNSVYVIEVLCPWCLVVTFSTTMLFATITHFNLRDNNFSLSTECYQRIKAVQKKDIGKVLTASWLMLMIALVFIKFGESLFI